MQQKSFGGRAPPNPLGEFTAFPETPKLDLGDGKMGREE